MRHFLIDHVRAARTDKRVGQKLKNSPRRSKVFADQKQHDFLDLNDALG
jgi:hypothetical protein